MFNTLRPSIILPVLAAAVLWAAPGVDRQALAQLPDPTRPMAAESGQPRRGLVLEAVLVSPARRLATVNGRVLAVGDRIRGAVVTHIEPNEVLLRKQGRTIRLRLVSRSIKSNNTQSRGQDQ